MKRNFLLAGVGALIAAALSFAPHAEAGPAGCMQSPWGGYCDGPVQPDGTHWHEQGAMGFWQSGWACPDFTPQNQHWAPC